MIYFESAVRRICAVGIFLGISAAMTAPSDAFSGNLSQEVSKRAEKRAFKKMKVFSKSRRVLKKEMTPSGRYGLIDLDPSVVSEIISNKPEEVSLSIPIDEAKTYAVSLIKVGSSVRLISEKGQQLGNDQSVVNYRGTIDGDSESAVSITFSKALGVAARIVSGKDKKKFSLERAVSNADARIAASERVHVVYNEDELAQKKPAFLCGQDDLQKQSPVDAGEIRKANSSSDIKINSISRISSEGLASPSNSVKLFVEATYDLYTANGSNVSNVSAYIQGLFNQVGAVYSNENITMEIKTIFIWMSQDPYPVSSSSAALMQFGSIHSTGFDGDLAVLLSRTPNNLGGAAYVGTLCSQPQYQVAFANIYNNYQSYPSYSWDLEVVSHELGHALGSQHTQWCGWTGGAIDGCVNPEGTCTKPATPPPGFAGTIMSYCHLNYSIDIALGFGQQPGNAIRNSVASAACLTPPLGGGGGADTELPLASITSPAPGAILPLGIKTTIQTQVSDNVGVVKVEFFINGRLRKTQLASGVPFFMNWKPTYKGNKVLVIKAYDAAGNVGESVPFSVTVLP